MRRSTVLIMAVILLLIATLLIQALPMEQSRLQDGIDTYSEKTGWSGWKGMDKVGKPK